MVFKTGIRKIRLTEFRSYPFLDMELDASFLPVVLSGCNGAGKTNILEAVSFLTPGRGLRSARLSDVARRNAEALKHPDVDYLPPRWSVSAQVETVWGQRQIGTGTIDGSERRQIKIDGRQVVRQSDLGDVLRCLWLTPAQDRLFCGDPVSRRRFLDRLVQAFDTSHANRLTDYNAAFKQWSCLLREGRGDAAWLSGLEEQMVLNGVAIAASRLDVVHRVSKHLEQSSYPLPTAEIILTGALEKELQTRSAVFVEDGFAERLKKSRQLYADGGPLSGPHTADFRVVHRQSGRDASFCSTGEQKALLLSIILAQMTAQMKEQGLCPLLLLDEVGAHLDVGRRNLLFDILYELPTQVWMTGTDSLSFSHLNGRAQFFDVENSVLNLKDVA